MIKRLHITIRGAVQGVGFRPFIYRLATDMSLKGWVLNSTHGVYIEAEGEMSLLERFQFRITSEKPPLSSIQSFESLYLDPAGFTTFEIRKSEGGNEITALILPDIAVCQDCLNEVFNPSNRRYLYPFTNCTNCGPRYSIIEALPYDRPNTTMKSFSMCDECCREYGNPLDRRFHAQPNACPACGPHVELWESSGKVTARGHEAIRLVVRAIQAGKIAALKGLGGFHLAVDARNTQAVERLRERKHREEKPLALIYPLMDDIQRDCMVSGLEEQLLRSPESPIVLLKRFSTTPEGSSPVSRSVAPGNPYLGIMLPYTPLHHIILNALKFPIVATSGNLSDEPICIDEHEAIRRLGSIADIFLVHNRPIRRHVDDSIVRVMGGRELVLRRARGYAPLPIELFKRNNSTEKWKSAGASVPEKILAVGAHLKNTVAVTSGHNVFVSQHIGDLETEEAFSAFKHVVNSLTTLYNIKPSVIAADMHPAYLSTSYAAGRSEPVMHVQHHYAHIRSCMAENQLEGDVLGIAWDGTGFGTDGTIWGGEFLRIDDSSYERVATFKQFRLPGGEQAVKEPRRTAIGILYEIFKEDIFSYKDLPTLRSCSENELNIFHAMVKQGVNSPLTSSAGRLFDAVASLAGVRQFVTHEGQAAMELEFLTEQDSTDGQYLYSITEAEIPMIIDWTQMFTEIIREVKNNAAPALISRKFHNTLASIIKDVAARIGKRKVVLSGGCFQNKYLTERTISELEKAGFQPYWHQRVPPNDGGIALGQVAAVRRELQNV